MNGRAGNLLVAKGKYLVLAAKQIRPAGRKVPFRSLQSGRSSRRLFRNASNDILRGGAGNEITRGH